MSKSRTAKRAASRASQNGDGNHQAQCATKIVPSSPMVNCLKVKVALRGSDGEAFLAWVEAANYHADGGLETFLHLMRNAPDDGFMSADASCEFAFSSVVAVRASKDSGELAVKVDASPPDAPRRTYARLKVAIGSSGETSVEVANVPWDENGLAHFATLLAKYRDHDFITSDFGFMPGNGIFPSRMTMPGQQPPARLMAMNPRDGVSLKDYPE